MGCTLREVLKLSLKSSNLHKTKFFFTNYHILEGQKKGSEQENGLNYFLLWGLGVK